MVILDDNKENEIQIVRLVWIILNAVLLIYAIVLFFYAKYWPKKEIRDYVIP